MAPPRRTRSTNKAQSTLSFRATKASASTPVGKDATKSQAPPPQKKVRLSAGSPAPEDDLAQPEPALVKSEHFSEPKVTATDLHEETAPVLEVKQSHDDIEDAKPEEEEEEEDDDEDAAALAAQYAAARALPTTRISSYWAGKERARRAPRVHQGSLSLHEKVLREFDVSSRYGPSVGIAREERWVRAWRLGLEPPVEVLGVLVSEGEDEAGSAGKSKSKSKARNVGLGERLQVSIIDELMGSTARGDRGTGIEV